MCSEKFQSDILVIKRERREIIEEKQLEEQ